MDPYLTPASRVRSDAIFHENLAIRAADIGDDYRKVGNLRQATLSYARASQYAEHAAELRHTAASLHGGDAQDVDIARCLTADSDAYDALANDCDTPWDPASEEVGKEEEWSGGPAFLTEDGRIVSEEQIRASRA